MKRILLKLSGEALAGAEKKGFDEATVIAVAKQIRTIVEEGTQVGIVIGGGNFWRGRTSETIDRNKADQIGMLATVMNCIYVSDICRYLGLQHRDFYTVRMRRIYKPLFQRCSRGRHLHRARFCSSQAVQAIRISLQIQQPFFALLRSRQRRSFLPKAVDGIYDSDPKVNPNAVKYDEICYSGSR